MHTKTKMVKTPDKKPTQHAAVPKKGNRVVRPFGAKKKHSELQDNYKMKMGQEISRARIDDTLSCIVSFLRTRLRLGTLKAPCVGGLRGIPKVMNLSTNYKRMVKGGGKVFRMPKTSALLRGKAARRDCVMNIGRHDICVGDVHIQGDTTNGLHGFVLFDEESGHNYVIDVESESGTYVKQHGYTTKRLLTKGNNFAVLNNQPFSILFGDTKKEFFHIEESSTPFEDSTPPFVPNIGRGSLRPRKKKD